MTGKIKRKRITQNEVINFEELSYGLGVYHLTLKNVGETRVLIDDGAGEYIEPGETFVAESDIGVVNDDFSLHFVSEQGKKNALIVSYVLPSECTALTK